VLVASFEPVGLCERRHLRSSISARKVLRKIDMRRCDGAVSPTKMHGHLRRSRGLLGSIKGFASSVVGARAAVLESNTDPEIGGPPPRVPPRTERDECCYLSLVEMCLRRPENLPMGGSVDVASLIRAASPARAHAETRSSRTRA